MQSNASKRNNLNLLSIFSYLATGIQVIDNASWTGLVGA
jgi:hypothetical protein